MPALESLTPAYVESFILACRDEGLTKEATAQLLQLHAAEAAFSNPGFAEGFAQVLREVPVRGQVKAASALGRFFGGGDFAGAVAGTSPWLQTQHPQPR